VHPQKIESLYNFQQFPHLFKTDFPNLRCYHVRVASKPRIIHQRLKSASRRTARFPFENGLVHEPARTEDRPDWDSAVNRVAASVCMEQGSDKTFHQIMRQLLNLGAVSLFLICQAGKNPDDLLVQRAAENQTPGDKRLNSTFPISGSPALAYVFSSREIIIADDTHEDPLRALLYDAGQSLPGHAGLVCAPLQYGNSVFGALVVAASDITREKIQSISMMAHIASISFQNMRIARDNTDLRKRVEGFEKRRPNAPDSNAKNLQDIVHALTVPIEKRDPYTYGHQKRVTRLAVAMAIEMGMPQPSVDGLRLAASVHDIGKIIVPFEILNRPSYLSEAEFSLIRMHPQVAFEILNPISFPWPVAEIVRQHHERCNGSGYPLGLTCTQILPEARVLAVADVVEAMNSHRPYRAALGFDAALEEVSAKSGVFYDSEAVAACIRLLFIKGFRLDDDAPAGVLSPFDHPGGAKKS
jgi:putative nucleotidyltransferase with HDIG domain